MYKSASAPLTHDPDDADILQLGLVDVLPLHLGHDDDIALFNVDAIEEYLPLFFLPPQLSSPFLLSLKCFPPYDPWRGRPGRLDPTRPDPTILAGTGRIFFFFWVGEGDGNGFLTLGRSTLFSSSLLLACSTRDMLNCVV